MSANFRVQYKKREGDLHLLLHGDLDGSSAWEVINLIRENYEGKGSVFIDTQHLKEIHPFGCTILKSHLKAGTVPNHCLFFKGLRGHEIAPDGSRVLHGSDRPGCGCAGNCLNCPCRRDAEISN